MLTLPPRSIDIRETLPYLLASWTALLIIGLSSHEDPNLATGSLRILAIFVLYTAVSLLGVLPVSSEWGYGTMPRLLAQPVPRELLWWHKFLASLVPLFLVLLMSPVAYFTAAVQNGAILEIATPLLLTGIANAALTGPFMAVYLRQTLTAVLATMIMPFVIITVVGMFAIILQSATGIHVLSEVAQHWGDSTMLIFVTGAIWGIAAVLLARHRFLRLEV